MQLISHKIARHQVTNVFEHTLHSIKAIKAGKFSCNTYLLLTYFNTAPKKSLTNLSGKFHFKLIFLPGYWICISKNQNRYYWALGYLLSFQLTLGTQVQQNHRIKPKQYKHWPIWYVLWGKSNVVTGTPTY